MIINGNRFDTSGTAKLLFANPSRVKTDVFVMPSVYLKHLKEYVDAAKKALAGKDLKVPAGQYGFTFTNASVNFVTVFDEVEKALDLLNVPRVERIAALAVVRKIMLKESSSDLSGIRLCSYNKNGGVIGCLQYQYGRLLDDIKVAERAFPVDFEFVQVKAKGLDTRGVNRLHCLRALVGAPDGSYLASNAVEIILLKTLCTLVDMQELANTGLNYRKSELTALLYGKHVRPASYYAVLRGKAKKFVLPRAERLANPGVEDYVNRALS